MRETTKGWLQQDGAHSWHPFTDQALWEAEEQLVITRGEGVYLYDSEGRRYFDGNSSIWTNIHGHSHPALVEAIQGQAAELCHSSYLGLANDKASELAEELCAAAALDRCFFSDNGSTAIEVALRMELQFRLQTGEPGRRKFIAFENSYHGDTLGAASLGGVGRFFQAISNLGPEVEFVTGLEELDSIDATQVAAVIIEPLIQGVNQMRPWPRGMLARLRKWCSAHDVHLILDEVMTGFGRTGALFACQVEAVRPDYLCLAKGLTGGTMPLAATLTTNEIYEAFKGEGNTFYYGHSYTGNALGCAVALASLRMCLQSDFLPTVAKGSEVMSSYLARLEETEAVIATRQCGMVAGIELHADGSGQAGKRFCQHLREAGMLTRPILDTIVWMPPLSSSEEEIREMGDLLLETACV